MLLRERPVPDEYQIMRALNVRMELSEDDKFRLLRLKKGYEGEVQFDLAAKNIKEERLIINDLLLKFNDSYFQIDSVLIEQGLLRLLDVKNYEDDYRLDGDDLYKGNSDTPCFNPLNSLKRSETLFRQLMQKYKLNIPVQSSLIFINPHFTLYQAPIDLPAIFPGQVEKFIKKINDKPSKLNKKNHEIANLLLSLHEAKNPKIVYPEYKYDQLIKKSFCFKCDSSDVVVEGRNLVCKTCDAHEKVDSAVLRLVSEFVLLFPEMQITTSRVFEWCGEVIAKKTIRKYLKLHFNIMGKTHDRYFE